MAAFSDSDGTFFISLVIMHSLTAKRYTDWKPWRFLHGFQSVTMWWLFYSLLWDDHLVENNKSGHIIMQTNGVMKMVNFMHSQTAETWNSFFRHSSPHHMNRPGCEVRLLPVPTCAYSCKTLHCGVPGCSDCNCCTWSACIGNDQQKFMLLAIQASAHKNVFRFLFLFLTVI